MIDNKLENLKGKMDGTVLKDIKFRSENEKSILLLIKNQEHSKKTLMYKFNPILSFTVLSILFIGVVYFGGIQSGIIENKYGASEEPLVSGDNNTIFTPKEQKENFSIMTKEEILLKMINSVDYFDTAIGSFELYYSNSNTKMGVEYELSIKDGGFVKTTGVINGEEFTNSNSYKGEYTDTSQLSLNEAFYENSNGEQMTNYRWHPPIEEAANSLFPYEIASNYTRNLNSWEIEEQNFEILGHNTVVISGLLNTNQSSKAKSNKFRFWVDKDSGILVKYETYNNEGDVIDYLHPKRLGVNVPVDTSKFENK